MTAEKTPTLRGIVFDKDGTLFDFNATWGSWTRGLLEAEAGGDPALTGRLAEVLGYDLEREVFHPHSVVIANTADTVADHILPLLPPQSKAALIARMNDRAATAPQVEAAPLGPFTDGLRGRGLTLGVVTNDGEAPARAHLVAAGVDGAFAFIAGFDSGHGAKPDPGPLFAFCAATGLDPAECVMVGDSTHDLHAGRAAGMVCIAVLTGIAGHDDLAPHADLVLPSIADLPAWLDGRHP